MNDFKKQSAILIAVIIACAIAARYAGRGETLLEYAEKNPDTAYAVSGNELSSDSSSR